VSTINIPTGASLVNAILCILVIAASIYILRKFKPAIKLVLYGTMGCAAIVLYHILTTPSVYDVPFSDATELMALLICISSLLAGYYIEVSKPPET
jgi:uncharacterized MnhB-related membrane protein